jgi:hypothetical protein
MTYEEALAIVLGPLPDVEAALTMPQAQWRALLAREREAMAVVASQAKPAPSA